MLDTFNNASGPALREKNNAHRQWLINLALVIIIFTVSLCSATQFFAYLFHYQPSLGVSAGHIYLPWSIIIWWSHWYDYYPNEFMQAGSIGVSISAIALLVLFAIKQIKKNSVTANAYLHGSARWANKEDIERAGLLPRKNLWQKITGKQVPHEGVYVGEWEDRRGNHYYLRHNGPEHVLTYAPTRSGKGVGPVLMTLLSWPHSAFIADLKGELWAMTSGWRQQYAHNKVVRFEPASAEGSAKWNPLDSIRLDTEYEVSDVQNLATLIVDPDGKGLKDHWQKTSQSLLVGLILHVLYKRKNENALASLATVDWLLSDPEQQGSNDELWADMISYRHTQGNNHPTVGASGQDMLARDEREAGSIISSTKSYLALYRDPVVAKNTNHSDFKIQDLMNHNYAVSLYIVTQPSDKDRLRPLVRVLINMIIRLLTGKMDFANGRPKAAYKHRLLGMIDEFPSLGKLEILQESLAYVAGYGIKFHLICQDINQLKSREAGYGQDETVTSNCHVQNAYPPNRIETAEYISKLTGTTTVIKKRVTTSGSRTSALLNNVSTTLDEVQRPLLTPDECLRMKGPIKDINGMITEAGHMVAYVAGYPMIYGHQPLYFKNPTFLARAAIAAPGYSDVL
ncbi:MAG: type IV secretory system conjugative DNA transfer family protein [Endozoicomonas sp. (ex Botrylloides leachii)]|nr:type IV secretory system conjugative DNA transfer family protein [Endozoicomonas sp. (ex Botrylloides leachii)]